MQQTSPSTHPPTPSITPPLCKIRPLTSLFSIKRHILQNLQVRLNPHIRLRHHRQGGHGLHIRRHNPTRAPCHSHGLTIRQLLAALPARDGQIARLALLRVHSGVLVENLPAVFIQAAEAAGDVALIALDNCVLSDVFDLVGLGVGVRDVGILVVSGEPFGGGGERFVFVGVLDVEGVGGLVDEDGEVGYGGAEHDDVGVEVVGVAVCGGDGDDVADVVVGMDGEAAEDIDHVDEMLRAVFVAAHDPGFGALCEMSVRFAYGVQKWVEGRQTSS